MTQEIYCKTSYIEWGTIIAGSLLACAITAVLLQFGAAVGLTQVSSYLSVDANITPGKILAVGIWVLWVQVIASLAGGYLAGRMRMPLAGASEHERDLRDGVHGLLVWALSTAVVFAVGFIAAYMATMSDTSAQEIVAVADVNRNHENAAIIFSFFAATTSLLSAVLSWWAATIGGDHRDTGVDHTRYFTFRVLR